MPACQQIHCGIVLDRGNAPHHRNHRCNGQQRKRSDPADGQIAAAAFGGALLFLIFLQKVVFFTGFACSIGQFLLMGGNDVADVFAAEAGKHRVAAAFASATAVAGKRIGPTAHAHPHCILPLGIARCILPRHKTQLIQRTAGLQGVGRIKSERSIALAPDGGVVEPDLFNYQVHALHAVPFAGQHHHAEPLAHAGLQALHALGLAEEQPVILIKTIQRYLNRSNHLIAQIVHHEGAFGVCFGGHGILPQFHRTRQVDLHCDPSLFIQNADCHLL